MKKQISKTICVKKSPKSGNNFIVPLHWISMRTGHLPDWSSPDDPARVLEAVGCLNPSCQQIEANKSFWRMQQECKIM